MQRLYIYGVCLYLLWHCWLGVRKSRWRRQGGAGEASPLWVDVQKLCNMCVLSLSWNFFVSHDKYIARPSSKEPRWYTDNTTGTGGLCTLDPLSTHTSLPPLLQNPGGATGESVHPVKIQWWRVGMVICLEQGADCLHMVQLMPLPSRNPTISCLIKIQTGLRYDTIWEAILTCTQKLT